MRFSSPLLRPDGSIDSTVYQLLSDEQWRRFALWSIECDRPVSELLRSARFVATAETSEDSCRTVILEGMLPHCGLYGGLCSDGSCHT
jgi:hypothetical protein